MPTIETITQEIKDEADFHDWGPGRIHRLINRGYQTVAAGMFPEYPEIPEICLPSLETRTSVYTASYTLAFTSGGTTEIEADDEIEGNTSEATSTVTSVTLDSGSWAGGDAAGTIYHTGQSGTFESETLTVDSDSDVATIAADSTNPVAYTSMPTDYQKKLLSVHSDTNNRSIKILPSLDVLLTKDSGLDQLGAVWWCCVVGSNLYYLNIPTSRETLYLHYFKDPIASADLGVGDTPSAIESHLQVPVLKSYCLREIWRLKEMKQPQKPNFMFYNEEFKRALWELSRFIGPYAHEPIEPNDVVNDYYE